MSQFTASSATGRRGPALRVEQTLVMILLGFSRIELAFHFRMDTSSSSSRRHLSIHSCCRVPRHRHRRNFVPRVSLSS